MSQTKAQALLDALQQYTALVLSVKPGPIKQIGGVALPAEHPSSADDSIGIEVPVSQEDAKENHNDAIHRNPSRNHID